jgi:hypothetical protein
MVLASHVVGHVIAMRQHFKVLAPIVVLLAVLVVNHQAGGSIGHQTVLFDVLLWSDSDEYVSLTLEATALQPPTATESAGAHARAGESLSTSSFTPAAHHGFPTHGTLNGLVEIGVRHPTRLAEMVSGFGLADAEGNLKSA